jgi:hypothetical protein
MGISRSFYHSKINYFQPRPDLQRFEYEAASTLQCSASLAITNSSIRYCDFKTQQNTSKSTGTLSMFASYRFKKFDLKKSILARAERAPRFFQKSCPWPMPFWAGFEKSCPWPMPFSSIINND